MGIDRNRITEKSWTEDLTTMNLYTLIDVLVAVRAL